MNNNEMSCMGKTYTIMTGDTLYKISRMYNVPLGELLEANKNMNIYNLQVGDKICIPVKEQESIIPDGSNAKWFVYIVRDEDTLEKILDEFNMNINDFMEANRQNNVMLKPGSIVVVPEKMM